MPGLESGLRVWDEVIIIQHSSKCLSTLFFTFLHFFFYKKRTPSLGIKPVSRVYNHTCNGYKEHKYLEQ